VCRTAAQFAAAWCFTSADVLCLSYGSGFVFAVDRLARRVGEGPAIFEAFAQWRTAWQKITPFLWYSKEAEEAAAFYTSIFPDSRVNRVTALPSESPSGAPGWVKVVEFVLFGQPFIAMSAGPLDPFNHAVSFVVN